MKFIVYVVENGVSKTYYFEKKSEVTDFIVDFTTKHVKSDYWIEHIVFGYELDYTMHARLKEKAVK